MKDPTPKNVFVRYGLVIITAIAVGAVYRFTGPPVPAGYDWYVVGGIVLIIVLALFGTISGRDRLKKMRREIWFGEKDDT
ncbi:hypothetical protein [Ponticaulis sp.]|uniref:hypothetical protein n=1 Tax=Ponticaulis sp. TaxID=2020902 RepID=UPI002632C05F|nr:hypothetical protein [Ponticaulis sp.]MDF1680184.1 hypothetical protein [Ponticaulis sp.]